MCNPIALSRSSICQVDVLEYLLGTGDLSDRSAGAVGSTLFGGGKAHKYYVDLVLSRNPGALKRMMQGGHLAMLRALIAKELDMHFFKPLVRSSVALLVAAKADDRASGAGVASQEAVLVLGTRKKANGRATCCPAAPVPSVSVCPRGAAQR